MKNSKKIWMIVILGFFCSLLFIEVGPFSSRTLSQYTNGYGTFDMKSYDYEGVSEILENVMPGGVKIAIGYYIGDFVFIIFFGLLQVLISDKVWKKYKDGEKRWKWLYAVAIAIPILRGVCDVIENVILANAYVVYPKIERNAIEIAGVATKCKLFLIMMWLIVIFTGKIINLIEKKRSAGNERIIK